MRYIIKVFYYSIEFIIYYISLIKDKIMGVDFTRKNSDFGGEGCCIYEGTHWYIKNLLKKILKGKISSSDFVIDIGCGKGAMLYFFKHLGFNNVAGIEYAEEISNIAKKNIDKLGCDNTEVYNLDATEFEAYGDYNYYYLYNPFGEEILDKVLKKIKSSMNNRKISVIYVNPRHQEVFDNNGFIEENYKCLKKYLLTVIPGIKVYTLKNESNNFS